MQYSTPLAMIHPMDGHQLMITTGPSPQDQETIITALRENGIEPSKVSPRAITLSYNTKLPEKKVITSLATLLKAIGFRPALPGQGRRTYRPL